MAASMVCLVHVIANACVKKLFRVPLVANISASRKTLQNCDLLLIYLLLDHTNIYCDLFYSLHLLIGASSKFIWTLIKTNGGGVVRNITSHFRSDSLPSTKQVYKKCLQKMSTKSVHILAPHDTHSLCKHMNELKIILASRRDIQYPAWDLLPLIRGLFG